jgi:4,5-DOPA dioxygenase extradiol
MNKTKMPLLFIGHGSPMNGIEDNYFTKNWKAEFLKIPTPSAVLCISAHWYTNGTFVTGHESPETLYDFVGFPDELYSIKYPAKGNTSLTKKIINSTTTESIIADVNRGYDHGTWSVLRKMIPDASIPVVQLSMNFNNSPDWHFKFAKFLAPLRSEGVLILGSGNIVHNLGKVDFSKINTKGYGYDWAISINNLFKQKIMEKDYKSLIKYQNFGSEARLAIPTLEHYLPLLYILGLREEGERLEFFNDELVGGSLSMTSLKIY